MKLSTSTTRASLARAGTRSPRARDRLGQQPVELANMTEGERAQERPQRRGRGQPAAQQPSRATRPQKLAVIDAVSTEQHRVDQRHHLPTDVRRAWPVTTKPHQPVREPLDPQPPSERRDQSDPRVGDHPLIVKDNLNGVRSDRFVIMHHSSDLLTQAPDCHHSREKDLLRRSFNIQPRTEPTR
jgi:hypothetical protein